MEKKRRRSKRVPFRTTLHFAPPPTRPHDHTSFVTDLSDKGICVKTKKAFAPGTRLHLFIDCAYKSYAAEGVVSWAKKVSPLLAWMGKNSMGIKFTQVDHRLVDFYEQKIESMLHRQGRLEIH
jgi:hypothetical protein